MSAVQNLYGRGFYDCDMWHYNSVTGTFGTTLVAAATGTKLGMVGTLWHPSRTGTFNIRKVHWRGGATAVNAASVIRVSLQDVSQTAGPPFQPDGVQDQTYDVAGSAMVTNGWNITGALSADRACAVGDSIAVVWEYQTFTAADSFIVNTLNVGVNTPSPYGFSGRPIINTASWALLTSQVSSVAFECDDGTFAFFIGVSAALTFGTTSVANNITARAAGNAFTVPVPIAIDRIGLFWTNPNSSDNILKLFSGTSTLLASKTIDNDAVAASNVVALFEMSFAPITLAVGTTYRIALEGNSTTAATLNYTDFNVAALMNSLWGGVNCVYTERDSGGSWVETSTRRAWMAIGLSGAHDGAGGGSTAINPFNGLIVAR